MATVEMTNAILTTATWPIDNRYTDKRYNGTVELTNAILTTAI